MRRGVQADRPQAAPRVSGGAARLRRRRGSQTLPRVSGVAAGHSDGLLRDGQLLVRGHDHHEGLRGGRGDDPGLLAAGRVRLEVELDTQILETGQQTLTHHRHILADAGGARTASALLLSLATLTTGALTACSTEPPERDAMLDDLQRQLTDVNTRLVVEGDAQTPVFEEQAGLVQDEILRLCVTEDGEVPETCTTHTDVAFAADLAMSVLEVSSRT